MTISKWSEQRESTFRAKVKAASQEERLQKWKEHFNNLFWNPPDKPIKRLIAYKTSSGRPQCEKKSKKIDKYFDLAGKQKKNCWYQVL